MKRIEVKLHLPAVAPLLDVVREAADTLGAGLAAPLRLEGLDDEFRAVWEADLVAAQNGDVRRLLALFDREFFSTGTIALDEDNADAVVRACAAVRLRRRGQALAAVSDEARECGSVDPAQLDAAAARAFMCYVFLATLQELCLSHLGPAVPEP